MGKRKFAEDLQKGLVQAAEAQNAAKPWQPPPGSRIVVDGDATVLQWPTSGLSEGQKIAEAVAIADAKRAGLPYDTPSGVNLGALQAPEAEQPAQPREKWPDTRETRKTRTTSPGSGTGRATKTAKTTGSTRKPASLSEVRAEIRRLKALLKARTRTGDAAPSRKSTPTTSKPPPSRQGLATRSERRPSTASTRRSGFTRSISRTSPAA